MNIQLGNMPTTKVKRQRFGVAAPIFMLVFGFGFAVAGVFIGKSSTIDASWQRVTGKVISSSSSVSNGSTMYTPVVQYTVNGQSYQVASSVSSSSYPAIGSTKQVAYDPSHPDHAKVVSSAGKIFAYVFIAIGVLAIVFAPIAFTRSLRRSRDISSLQQTGQKLQGVITDIQAPNIVSGNNNSGGAYKIVVSATDAAGNVRTFTSDSLSGIGGLAMADFRSSPIPMDVYVNPANPSDYYVDISEVPSLTPQRIQELISSALHNNAPESVQPNQTPPTVPPTN